MSIKLMTNEVMKIADKLTEELDGKFEQAKGKYADITMHVYIDQPITHRYNIYVHYNVVVEQYTFTFMMDDLQVFWYREDALKSIFCDVDLTTFVMACLGYIAMKENF